MNFEYRQELQDIVKQTDLQARLKVNYTIGVIAMYSEFTVEEDGELNVKRCEIMWVESIDNEVPIYLTHEQKAIVADYIDYDDLDAECYAQWDRMISEAKEDYYRSLQDWKEERQ